MKKSGFIPLEYKKPSEELLIQYTSDFYRKMKSRRSVRHFSDKVVPDEVIQNIIMTAASAPSGAHKQPWTFCVIKDPDIKAKIRVAAEKEEYENYHGRMSDEWLKDLEKFETDWKKEFLTTAPCLIVIFRKAYDQEDDGSKSKNYYVSESVGIAAGFLIAAIHMAGLVTLTHTPSPMNFLQELLGRPENEKPFLLLPVGFPADGVFVPDINRKKINEVLVRY
ncbi:MAG: nitroreductase family protein [Saprospiraceae bacterium]|nr:nitroreductase family protein [Saprospiraceae bacterium]